MRILMISSTFPYPPSRGGTEVRTFNLLKYLCDRHLVTLATQRSPDVTDDDIQGLENFVDTLALFSQPQTLQSSLYRRLNSFNKLGRLATSVAKGTPPNVLHRYSRELQAWINHQVRIQAFDAITCEHSVNAIYIRPRFQTSLKTVLNAHSLGYNWTLNHLRMKASDDVLRDRLYLSSSYRYERRFAQQFSTIVVTTPDDQQQLAEMCPGMPSQVIPNGVDLDTFRYRTADLGGHHLVFVGAMDGSHNVDAMQFFVKDVLPRVRQRYPDTHLSIVGARPTPAALALQEVPGVTVTGKVPSVVDYLHQATVCVVPLRTGFGIKNKTLEAMAAGVPIVGSDRGLEGLEVDGDGVPRALRANQIEDYVDAISQLFEQPDLRLQLSQNGRSLVESTYTWERAGERYEHVLTR
ncbi:MAG: glycosyltransferase family 4 protein [Elainellaceae cyanobacterium]